MTKNSTKSEQKGKSIKIEKRSSKNAKQVSKTKRKSNKNANGINQTAQKRKQKKGYKTKHQENQTKQHKK